MPICVLVLKFVSVVRVFVCWNSKEAEKVLEKVQEFIISLSNFTEGENQRLSGEVSPKCQTEPTEVQKHFEHVAKTTVSFKCISTKGF